MNRRDFLFSTSGLLLTPSALIGQEASAAAPTNLPVSSGMGADRPGFDRAIEQFLQETGAPGCAFAVIRDGRVTYSRGYGYADKETKERFAPKSLCRIASLTKPLTAFTILRLVEQDKLSLSERVFPLLGIKPFPLETEIDPRLDKVTVEQCLNMTGGWSRSKAKFDRGDRMIEIGRRVNVPFPNSPQMSVRMLYGMGLDYDPGSRQEYANEGYWILGQVIEKISGSSYIEAIREYTGVTPAKLGHSRQAEKYPGEVAYYSEKPPMAKSLWPQDNGKLVPWYYGSGQPLEATVGAGEIVCSIEDYAGFVARLSDRTHPALKPETWDRITAIPSCLRESRPQSWYGLGWYLFQEGASLLFIHGGVMYGNCAKVNSRPDRQTLLFLCNYNNAQLNFHDLLMPRLHESANKGA